MSTTWKMAAVLSILGLLSSILQSEGATLVWEWDGIPAHFVLTMTPETGNAQTRTVPPQRCFEPTPDGWETYCTPMQCTIQGVFDLTVRAETAQESSPPSVPLRVGCLGYAGHCACTGELSGPVAEDPPTPPPPDERPPDLPAPPQRTQPLITAIRPYHGEVVILFRHPRAATSLPTRFLLSYTSPTLTSRMLYAVPLHDVTACQQLLGTDTQTWCTRLGCPGSGAWTFDVRAEYPEAWGPVSPSFACTIAENAPDCTCQGGAGIPVAERVPAPAPHPSRPPEQPTPPATEPPPAPLTPTPAAPPPTPGPPAPVTGTNLVQAPSQAHPWKSDSFAGTQTQTGLDRTVQRTGQPVQKLTGRGDYFAQTTSPSFAVEAGTAYEVSAWVKLHEITKGVEVDVFYWDKDGKQLRAWGEAIGGRRKGTRTWTKVHGQLTVPARAVRAVIQTRVRSRGGAAWIADVQMSPRQEEAKTTD